MTIRYKTTLDMKVMFFIVAFFMFGFNVSTVLAGDAWSGLLWRGETYTKNNRMQIAKGFLEDIYEPMNAFIPNPKPSEREWVKNEQRDMQTLLRTNPTAHFERRDKLMRSPEYCLVTLKERLGKIIHSLGPIAKRGASLSIREEMALWAEVVYWITTDTNEADNNFLCLENARVIDAQKVPGLMFPPGSGHDYWFMKTMEASTILDRIIIPYLKNEIKR